MKYFMLMYDYENDDKAICGISKNLYDIDRYELEKGKIINNWDERISFFYNPAKGNIATDYLGNDLGWFIISSPLKELFENLKLKRIQYLPINIINESNNQKLDGYYVANIYNLIDALELKNSKYNEFEIDKNRKYISVQKYALKRNIIKGINILRLEKDAIPIFVSEAVKKSMLANKVTGCDFLEVKVV